MKIDFVSYNNRRKTFTIKTANGEYSFPYAKSNPTPSRGNYVRRAYADEELGSEAFTYELASGEEGTIHLDAVLEYNEDPEYMKDLLLYNLTLELQRSIEKSSISKREIIKNLATSPTQFYRIIDPKNTRKSLSQILKLFYSLGYDLELVIKKKAKNRAGKLPAEDRVSVSAR